MNITFICVNFNNLEFCLEYVRSIRVNSTTASIIIVDNSDDISYYQKLLQTFDADINIKIVRQNENMGYFSALNFGLNYANKKNYVIIGNNDLSFDSNFIATLDKKTHNSDVAVICPNVITKNGRHQNPHVLHRMGGKALLKLDLYYSNFYVATFLNFFYVPIKKIIHKISPPPPKESSYIHMGIGACYIIQPVFWKHYNELEFPFFLYGEEAFLSNQVHKIGYQLFYDADLIVHHAESGTLSLLPKRKTYEFAKAGYPTYRQYL